MVLTNISTPAGLVNGATGKAVGVVVDSEGESPLILYIPVPVSTILNTNSGFSRQDRWSQRANARSPLNSLAALEKDTTSTIQLSYTPTEIDALNDDEDETQIIWPDTPDDTQSSPQPYTPTSGRRSQRPRKSSYAIAQS
ncbi:uncharacterized protein N7511_004322 [Penicillium nucicola]|uniref:uncharacterized protein n=1 Tax=Penicillium nucicola TaxID=1850975 RepID=UPI002545422A|nr:uncharacterized protein N7511_004322 [Penicillium nucicola]KAJ5766706.1 hypothetical protein N7511_004322 [Penicillium nucicola]